MTKQSQPTSQRPRLALLVGNSTFQGGLAPLPGAIRDVTALHLQLSSGHVGYRSEHVRLAIEADLATLKQAIEALCDEATRLDASSILLYLSTHGFYHQDQYHLCVADSVVTPDSTEQTLPFETLRAWLAPLQDRAQILLLDSCRTREQKDPYAHTLVSKDGLAMVQLPAMLQMLGQTPEAEQPATFSSQAPRREDLHLTGENWAIVTSASNGEMAWLERATPTPFQDGPHSIFTRALLDELSSSGGAGAIDIVTLHERVSQRVQQRVASLRHGITQTPCLILHCQTRPIVAERPASAGHQGEPFRHLDSFSRHDHHRFFGREGEIALAIGDTETPGATGWLFARNRHHILSAPSGAGKSSFLQAGLQPRLEERGHLVFTIDCRIPHDLFKQLFAYLGDTTEADLPTLLERCMAGRTGEVILLLDQFESLLLDERLQLSWEVLCQQLDALVHHTTPIPYRLLLALREDCVGRLLHPPIQAGLPGKTTLDMADSILSPDSQKAGGKASKIRFDMADSILSADTETPGGKASEIRFDMADSILSADTESPGLSLIDVLEIDNDQWHTLPFLQFAQAREAIRKPLEGGPVQFSDALIFAMLQDLHQYTVQTETHARQQSVYPPYLQILCHTLYEEAVCRGWPEVQVADYRQMGSLDTLLGRHLQNTLQGERGKRRLSAAEQERAWLILKSLVSAEGRRLTLSQEQLTQRLAQRGISAQQTQQSLEALSQRRLITCVDVSQSPYWSLTHDLLCHLVLQEIERDPHELELRQAHRSLETLRDEWRQARKKQQTLPWLELERARQLAQALDEVRWRITEHPVGTQSFTSWQEGEFAQLSQFIEDSITARLAEIAQQETARKEREALFLERERLLSHRSRLVSWGLGGLMVLLVVLAGIGFWARQQRTLATQARTQAQQARARLQVAKQQAQRSQQKAQAAVRQAGQAMQQARHAQQLATQARASQQQALRKRDALLQQVAVIKRQQQKEQAQAAFRMGLFFLGDFTPRKASERDKRFLLALRFLQQAYRLHVQRKDTLRQARVLFHMARSHRQINQDRPGHLQAALRLSEQALALLSKARHPLLWADLMTERGNIYQRYYTNRQTHLRLARESIQQALTIYSKQKHPQRWAIAQNSLGSVWFHQRSFVPDSLRKAIHAYRQALTVMTRQDKPQDWARILHNLAGAIASLPDNKGIHQRQAIQLYKQSLEVKTFAKYPLAWAQTMHALGNAYMRLAQQEPAQARHALYHYRQALSVFSPGRTPFEWSKTVHNIGILYTRSARGTRREPMLHRAIQTYQSILRLTGAALGATQRAQIYYDMGVAYGRFPGQQKNMLHRAIASYTKALQTFDPKRHAREWRRTLENLTIVRIRLHQGLQGKARRQMRESILQGLQQIIRARQEHGITRGLWGYRLAYAEYKQDPLYLYKELHRLRKQHGLNTSLKMRLAEASLHLQRYKEAEHWLKQTPARKRAELRLWQLHLGWQTALLLSSSQAPRRCLQWLQTYRTLQVKRWQHLEFGATRRFLQRIPAQVAAQIERSLALFSGAFSCARLRAQASRCGLQWPQHGQCAQPSSRPNARE